MRSRARAALVCAAVVLCARAAAPHDAGTSRGDYRLSNGVVSTVQTFASAELATAFPEIDRDHDGVLSALEIERGGRALGTGIVDFTELEADDDPCAEHFESVRLEATDAVVVRASFTCIDEFTHLTIDCGFLDRFPAGHVHLAIMGFAGGETSRVATQGDEAIDVDVPTRKSRRSTGAILGGTALGVVGGLACLRVWRRRRRQSRADM